MSKIGRKPIVFKDVTVEIKGSELVYKGKHASGTYQLPSYIAADLKDNVLNLSLTDPSKNNFWGMHRALLSNILQGAAQPFEKKLEINGLGFKAAVQGKNVVLTLGYSHKIDYVLPAGVTMEVDKSGQRLTLMSADKQQLGQACASIRAFRKPEPYKGTGIKLATEHIIRKAGKAKAA